MKYIFIIKEIKKHQKQVSLKFVCFPLVPLTNIYISDFCVRENIKKCLTINHELFTDAGNVVKICMHLR